MYMIKTLYMYLYKWIWVLNYVASKLTVAFAVALMNKYSFFDAIERSVLVGQRRFVDFAFENVGFAVLGSLEQRPPRVSRKAV